MIFYFLPYNNGDQKLPLIILINSIVYFKQDCGD